MKPVIAALAAAFLLASAGDVLAQNAPTNAEQKSPSSSTAVDCHKMENAKNQVCMKAAKDQTAAQARRAIRR